MTQETATTYHIPVLLAPAVDGLDIRPDGIYVDATLGGGGHTREILRRLGPGGRLLGFDQDEDAERNIPDDPRFTFVRSNFRYLHNFLRYHGIGTSTGCWPTWAYRPTTSTTASAASPSASTARWTCA